MESAVYALQCAWRWHWPYKQRDGRQRGCFESVYSPSLPPVYLGCMMHFLLLLIFSNLSLQTMLWQVSCPSCSMRLKSAETGTTPSRSSATPSLPTPWTALAAGGSLTRSVPIDQTALWAESPRYSSLMTQDLCFLRNFVQCWTFAHFLTGFSLKMFTTSHMFSPVIASNRILSQQCSVGVCLNLEADWSNI